MFYFGLLLIAYLLVNGIFMIFAPQLWFQTVPGVTESGTFNAHFVTDVGFAYLLTGAAIIWRLIDPLRARSAALFGAGFLILHAAFHCYGTIVTPHHDIHWATDVLGIYLPALIAMTLALRTRVQMPSWFQRIVGAIIHREIKKFENTWGYNAAYMHEIVDTDTDAIGRFSLLQELGDYRKGIPASAWHTVKLLSCIQEDCGPCTQLVVQMAEQDGISRETLSAVVEGHRDELDESTALFYDYALAVLNHDLESEDLRQRIVEQYGHAAIISAGLSMITGKAYPLMKYALGHGQHCVRVSVGGEIRNVPKKSPVAASFT